MQRTSSNAGKRTLVEASPPFAAVALRRGVAHAGVHLRVRRGPLRLQSSSNEVPSGGECT